MAPLLRGPKPFAALLCLLVLAPACGLDVDYTGMGDRALAGDPEAQRPVSCICECRVLPAAGSADGGVEGEGEGEGDLLVEDLSARTFRFDSLVLSAPLTGFLAEQINGYFAEEIEAGNMNILMHIAAHDRANGDLLIEVGPASVSDGAYRFEHEPSDLGCVLSGATFITNEPAHLAFPSELLVPPSLPIQELGLSGRLDPGAEVIMEGVLKGALSEEDAAGIAIGGTDFKTFLAGLGIPTDMDLSGDEVMDAWRFEGTYSAAKVELAQEEQQ